MTALDTITQVADHSSELRYLWTVLREHLNDDDLERVSNTLSYLYDMIGNGCYPLLTEEKLHRESVVRALSPFVSQGVNFVLLSRHTPFPKEDWMSPSAYREAAQAALVEGVDGSALSSQLLPYKHDIARCVRAGSLNVAPYVHSLSKAVWSSFHTSLRKTPLWPQENIVGQTHRLSLKGAFDTFFEIVLCYLSYATMESQDKWKFCAQCERLIKVMEHCFILGEKRGSLGTWVVLVD